MIKVVFTYQISTEHLPELMKKFKESTNPEFNSEVTNKGIKMYKREQGEDTFIVLDIFYDSIEDYQTRTKFEQSQDSWNEIWFNPQNKHKEISVEIFEVL